MLKIVKKAIDEFNPYGLLPEAPDDEFDGESSQIADRINVNSTVEEIAEIISKVFSEAFDEDFDLEDCRIPAEKIYTSIKNE